MSGSLFENRLNYIDALHVATVLEDTVDQLVILGRVMPGNFQQLYDDAAELVNSDLQNLTDRQKLISLNFQNALLGMKPVVGGGGDVHAAAGDVKRNASSFAQAIKQSPLAQDNMDKLQADRAYLEKVLHDTAVELFNYGTFHSLNEAVQDEKNRCHKMEETIRREAEGRRKTKLLQTKLAEVKKERQLELQKRLEMIAHLKDQVQEMKSKTMMETKYVEKVTEVSSAQAAKKCAAEETKLLMEVKDLRSKIEEENRVNAEIESFLRTHIDKRQEQLRDWVDKYDTEVDMKQKELDLLKAAKAADYERLIELTRLYHEYEQVVVDDRIEKEKQRRKLEREKEERERAIQIQSWWRGMMVRRCLGQYKPKKGKKKKEKGKK